MEVLLPAIILEEQEDDDLLIYCMSEDATDISKKRKDEGYYSSLLGRFSMDSEMKFRGFFRVSRNIFHLTLTEVKEDITRSCNRWQAPISDEQKLCLMLRYVDKQATIFNTVLLIIQSVITVIKNCKYTNHLNLKSSAKLEVLGSNSSFSLLLPSSSF
jgi:hypothetical protein